MTITKILLVASLAGCASDDTASDEHRGSKRTAVTTDLGVKEVPAVDHQHYPDNIAYLYQSDLATVLWMQNVFTADSVSQLESQLENQLKRDMTHGLSAEFLVSHMQHVAPVFDPELETLARHAAQSTRLLGQYTFTASDYARSLGAALGTYNGDPARLDAVIAAAAQLDTALSGIGTANPGSPLPAPPPPVNRGVVRPGRYFAAAVQDGERAYVQTRARTLQRAIASHDTTAYGAAFSDVFYAQLDPNMRDAARTALDVSHEGGILEGQPLDTVIAQYVTKSPGPDQSLTMDQLRLINQINLVASPGGSSNQPLVAALLLLDLDRRLGEQDDQLSCSAIAAHIHDVDWLVAQYVRVKANGTTAQDVLGLVDNILSNLAAR